MLDAEQLALLRQRNTSGHWHSNVLSEKGQWMLYLDRIRRQSRSQSSRGLRRTSAAARLLRLWVRTPPVSWMSVCCEYGMLWGRVLCDELIPRTEESYRLCCVVVCDLEGLWMRRIWPTGGRGGLSRQKKEKEEDTDCFVVETWERVWT